MFWLRNEKTIFLLHTLNFIRPGKCSKILTTFLFLSSKKWNIRAGSHKMLVRIANREDPDQTASSEAV